MRAGPLPLAAPASGPLNHGALAATLLATAVSAELGQARTALKPQ